MKLLLILIIMIILITIAALVILFYNKKKTKKDGNTEEDQNNEDDKEDDNTPTFIPEQCIKEAVTVEDPSIMLKKFFDNYSENYLYNPETPNAAVVLSEYDPESKKVKTVVPYNMYQKILKSKISSEKISVFIGQVVVSAGKIETPYGTKNPLKPLQIFHSALFFVETTKYIANEKVVLPEDILFTVELWAPGQGFGAASCLYPILNGSSIDILQQDVSKIIVQYPEAFGCKSDGAYWDGHWDETFYLGDTSVSTVEQLYDISFTWLSTNWGYTAVSLVSSSCIEDKELPTNAVLGNTCESFVQAMCIELQKLDKTFTNLLSNLPFNDVELIGTWNKLDLSLPPVVEAINKYNATIQLILEKASETKEQYDYNDIEMVLPKYAQNFLKKKLVNSDVTLGEDGPENRGKQNDISNKVNLALGAILIPMLIAKLAAVGMVDENGKPVLLISTFNTNAFDVYQITLERPYLQSIYSTCPSMLYEKIHA